MFRFGYLLDQLKSPNVKAVLGVLLFAKSKLIKVIILLSSSTKPVPFWWIIKQPTHWLPLFICLLSQAWKELDIRITDSANEAKHNVKYLYTLERFCDPLYNRDPVRKRITLPLLTYVYIL